MDISEDGLEVLNYKARQTKSMVHLGQSMKVNLRLPNIFAPLLLTGKITRSHQIGKSAMMSIGIQLTPTEKQAAQLKNYNLTRQAEILDELSSTLRTVLEPIQTKDLNF